MERKEIIRTIYLYLFSLVGLVLIVIGCVRLIDLGLRMFVFTKADQVLSYPAPPRTIPAGPDGKEQPVTVEQDAKMQEEQKKFDEQNREAQRQRTAANSLAVIIVGAPLFAYHWRIIKKDKQMRSA